MIDVELFETREGMWRARVTMADYTVPAVPYEIGPQIVEYTHATESPFWALTAASDLIQNHERKKESCQKNSNLQTKPSSSSTL